MKRLLFLIPVLAYSATASAQSVIIHADSVTAARVHVDTVSDLVAAKSIIPDSLVPPGFRVFNVNTGDVNGDGTVGPADIIYLVRTVFLAGPKPKRPFTAQIQLRGLDNGRRSLWFIFCDSTGVQR